MTKRKPVSAAPPFTLGFPQLDREIASHAGETIYQSARRSGVRIVGACGGRGTCGTCRVLVVEGEFDDSQRENAAGHEKRREQTALGARLPGDAEIRLHRGDCAAIAGPGGAGRIRRRRNR